MKTNIPARVFDDALLALLGEGKKVAVFNTKLGPSNIEFRASHHADLETVKAAWSSVMQSVRRTGTADEIDLPDVHVDALKALTGISVKISSDNVGVRFPLLEDAKIKEGHCTAKPSINITQQILGW
jgi:hypothetical protein